MKKEARIDAHLTEDLPLRGRCLPKGRRKEFMNRKKIIRIIVVVLAVAALLAAGGCALWKNGFFEKINSVEALREVSAGAGVCFRSGYVMAREIGMRISGAPSCAITAPSLNSTIEWTIDCRCTTAVTFSSGRS